MVCLGHWWVWPQRQVPRPASLSSYSLCQSSHLRPQLLSRTPIAGSSGAINPCLDLAACPFHGPGVQSQQQGSESVGG